MHPISALPLDATALPHDLPLEPRDCLILYGAMKAAARTSENRKSWKELGPERFFQEAPYIRKADCLRYEEALKAVLSRWMARNPVDGAPAYREVVRQLAQETVSAVSDVEQWWAKNNDGDSAFGREFCEDTIYPLCLELEKKDMLPAIFFLYDRYVWGN